MNDENEGIIAALSKTIEQNWRLLLVGVIILAIALNSSWSSNKPSTENKNTATPQANQSNETQQNKPEENKQNAGNNGNNVAQAQAPDTASTTVNTSTNANTIAETAAKSEGVTHLARRAIKEYLASNQESLGAEQKIYAEDYLRKKTGTKALKVGEKLEFNTDLIKQGVEKAKGLNQKQIENLSKYVPLARNLN